MAEEEEEEEEEQQALDIRNVKMKTMPKKKDIRNFPVIAIVESNAVRVVYAIMGRQTHMID